MICELEPQGQEAHLDYKGGLQELIDRLAAENAISEQDCQWLMYGACLPTRTSLPTEDPLAMEVDDLSQQVGAHMHQLCIPARVNAWISM